MDGRGLATDLGGGVPRGGRGFLVAVLSALSVAAIAGGASRVPGAGAPAYALESGLVYRLEVGLVVFAVLYVAVVVVRLALHGLLKRLRATLDRMRVERGILDRRLALLMRAGVALSNLTRPVPHAPDAAMTLWPIASTRRSRRSRGGWLVRVGRRGASWSARRPAAGVRRRDPHRLAARGARPYFIVAADGRCPRELRAPGVDGRTLARLPTSGWGRASRGGRPRRMLG